MPDGRWCSTRRGRSTRWHGSRAWPTSRSSSTPTRGSERRSWRGSTGSRSASTPRSSSTRSRPSRRLRASEAARVAAGWPRMGSEIVPGETIPAMTGLIAVAVSVTKGCYPGQELVERMDSRGAEAPRSLRVLVAPADAAAGDPIVDGGGAEVGVYTSVVAVGRPSATSSAASNSAIPPSTPADPPVLPAELCAGRNPAGISVGRGRVGSRRFRFSSPIVALGAVPAENSG